MNSLSAPQGLPLLLLGVLLFVLAVRKWSVVYAFLAVVCVVAACAAWSRGTWFTSVYGAIPIHLVYAAVLLAGAVCHGRTARLFQNLAAVVLVGLLVGAMVFRGSVGGSAGAAVAWIYMAVVVALPFVYGRLVRNVVHLYVGLADLGVFAVFLSVLLCRRLGRAFGAGAVQPFFWSALAFVIALVISLTKFRGVLARVRAGVLQAYGKPRPGT
jgi:hypothetical protein